MLLQTQTLISHLLVIDFYATDYIEGIIASIALLIWCWLNVYIVAVEVRFLTQWFLNINPYFEPFLTLWNFTNPVFIFGRRLYPKVLGIDLAPIINFKILAFLIGAVEPLAFSNF